MYTSLNSSIFELVCARQIRSKKVWYIDLLHIECIGHLYIHVGLYRVAQKERNGILPVIIVNNDWYQWMVCFLLRKMIPRSAILVKVDIQRYFTLIIFREIAQCQPQYWQFPTSRKTLMWHKARTYTTPLSIWKTYGNSPNTADICDVTKGKKLARADYVL